MKSPISEADMSCGIEAVPERMGSSRNSAIATRITIVSIFIFLFHPLSFFSFLFFIIIKRFKDFYFLNSFFFDSYIYIKIGVRDIPKSRRGILKQEGGEKEENEKITLKVFSDFSDSSAGFEYECYRISIRS
jgi:hypothetical protein